MSFAIVRMTEPFANVGLLGLVAANQPPGWPNANARSSRRTVTRPKADPQPRRAIASRRFMSIERELRVISSSCCVSLCREATGGCTGEHNRRRAAAESDLGVSVGAPLWQAVVRRAGA